MMASLRSRWLLAAGAALVSASGALVALSGCGGQKPPAPAEPVAAPSLAGAPAAASLAKLPVSASALPDFAGSKACVECHQDYAEQLTTHHAATLGKASDPVHAPLFERKDRVFDPARGVHYSPERSGAELRVKAGQGKAGEAARADWVFGSGNRCYTYVGDYDGKAVELRISYYRKAGKWDFTPGQRPKDGIDTPVGRSLSLDDAVACLNCHTTAAVVENGVPDPARSLPGVGCESCHGAGKAHIEAVRRGDKDIKMLRLAGVRDRVTEELCGSCHRTTATGGDPHDPTTQGQLPRLQGPALMLSRCFKESNGKLGCVTCHNPHRDSTRTTRAEYNRICGSCHGAQPQQSTCPKAPRGDCVSCHMPTQEVEMPTRPSFSTHWIKVWDRLSGGAKKTQ